MNITPGKWELSGNTIIGVRPDAPTLPLAIAQAFQIINYGDQRDRDMTIANARAIAEIPNLIEALREFLDLCPRVSDDDPIASALANQCRYAKLILKRIEG